MTKQNNKKTFKAHAVNQPRPVLCGRVPGAVRPVGVDKKGDSMNRFFGPLLAGLALLWAPLIILAIVKLLFPE